MIFVKKQFQKIQTSFLQKKFWEKDHFTFRKNPLFIKWPRIYTFVLLQLGI